MQHSGVWKRRFEASAHYARITGDARPLYPPVMLEELTGKNVLLVGYGAIGKEIETDARALSVLRWCVWPACAQ